MTADAAQSGGCQCGAVRFRVTGRPERVSLCHCRMCQKATGAPFQVVAIVDNADLVWTRGDLARFQSSTVASRGFCRKRGTPMTYEWGGQGTAIAIGTFDDPRHFSIDSELSRETRLACVSQLANLPEAPMAANAAEEARYAHMDTFQHPDHDTEAWPASEEFGHGR